MVVETRLPSSLLHPAMLPTALFLRFPLSFSLFAFVSGSPSLGIFQNVACLSACWSLVLSALLVITSPTPHLFPLSVFLCAEFQVDLPMLKAVRAWALSDGLLLLVRSAKACLGLSCAIECMKRPPLGFGP